MKFLILIVGAIFVLLGCLWMLQGLGIVHMQPILCFANCSPVEGPSTTWAVIGFFTAAAGLLAIRHSLKRRPRK